MEIRGRLSDRERRLLALAGLGLVAALYASLAAMPLLQRYLTTAAALRAAHALRPAAAGGAGLSARSAEVTGEAARLRARLAALEEAVPRRLDGVSLLEDLEGLAGAAGLRVRHLDLGSPGAAGGEIRQRVEVELSGATEAHLGFLAALDGKPWLMRVQSCTLEAAGAGGEGGDAADAGDGAPGTTAEPVRMTCQLSFFLAANR